MREQNIEVIRKACVAANPEIMELKFGCGFRFPRGKYGVLLCNKEWKRAKFLVDLPLLPPHYDELRWDDMEDIEIVGRPIRLADVLVTLDKRDYLFCVNASGLLYREDDGPVRPFVYYDLRKDSLTDQSDECLTFLADLLK